MIRFCCVTRSGSGFSVTVKAERLEEIKRRANRIGAVRATVTDEAGVTIQTIFWECWT